MQAKMSTRYVVISPVRDEAQYVEQTARSMVAQTIRPVEWVLVNDGSSDGTAEIINRLSSEQNWITAVHRHACEHFTAKSSREGEGSQKRGTRALEAKEIKAFYEGYRHIRASDWGYIVKLDGDVSFEPNYFEKCFLEFDADPQLGIGGGEILNLVDGQLKAEPTPRFHVRGATKIYRRACWDEIGGVKVGAGWDTLDEVKANMMGWSTRSFRNLQVVHHRYTGAANGAWSNAFKNGMWAYISGYHPLYMLIRCIRRLIDKPYLVTSSGLLCGFLMGYLRRVPQDDDKRLIQYLREQQMRRLLFRTSSWK